MQNPLENFLLNLAEKIQTEKEYKDIVKDSQNVDVNKDVFAGFIDGISKTIRENVQIPSLSALEEKQDPLDNFLLSLGETLKNIPEKKKEDISEPVAKDLEQTIEKEEPDAFAGFVDNLANILKKEQDPDPEPVKQEQDPQPVKQEQKPVQDYVNILSSEKKKKEKPPIEKKQEENEETPDIKKFVTNFVSKELEAFKNDLTEKYLKKAAVLSEYAGGGGTNAVQYANGGVMNGDLNVSNVYPNDATGSIGSPSNRWDKIYANQVDSLSSNIVIELSGFYVDGDFTVNGTISAIGGNSNQWNSTYTTLSANSGKYESAYTSLNANSGKYESTYTSLNANSGKYESTYTNLNTNSAKYILSGGNITNSSLYIGSNTNYNLFLKTNNLPRVVITQAGNVGIGTGEVSNIVLDQSLIGYNFSVLKSSVASTASASLAITSDITANRMQRSSGIGAFASALGWGSQAYTIGGTNWQTAIQQAEYFTIPIYSETNKTITINSLDSFWVDRSPNGPTNLALLYGTSIIPTLNNVSEITTGVSVLVNQWTDTSLQINQALSTNPITILPGTSGFIFLVPYGAGTNTGNLRFQSNYPSGSANDLSFRGRISNEPFNKLTVNGTISAIGGNSNQWNSTYTTVNTFSAYWPVTLGLGISSNINFGVCAGNGAVTANLQTIAGANIGDAVLVTCTSQRGSFAPGEMSNVTFDGIVTATNQVSIRAHNPHNNTITLSALDFKILIFKSV